jgi:uncharacterized protein (DUF934 family)
MRFVDASQDAWRAVADGAAPSPAPHSLLTLAQWREARGAWPQDVPVAVAVPNDAAIEELADDLPRIGLVVLHFPKWTDGRAYSQARLLRVRFRYGGAVRATGAVLVDMVPMLVRTGFDEAALRDDQKRETAERALRFFPAHYQADVHEHRPLYARWTAA